MDTLSGRETPGGGCACAIRVWRDDLFAGKQRKKHSYVSVENTVIMQAKKVEKIGYTLAVIFDLITKEVEI